MELADTVSWDAKQYGKFSTLIRDYLNQNEKTSAFYSKFPSKTNLVAQAHEKLGQYKNRDIVYAALKNQLSGLDLSSKQMENLEKLQLSNSVTITTGHQLNLLTGPLYFFYKIIEVLKACEEMNQIHPEINFIPVFWMATEDHDFEEINHFYFKDQKFVWNKNANGAVGRLDLNGIESLFESFFQQLPDSQNAKSLKSLIENSYLNASNLTEATLKLVHQIFGAQGLLMIDGDDKALKKLMIPAFEEDLLKNTGFEFVGKTNATLEKENYPIQVNPREINLFYLGEGNIRERIVYENDSFQVLNSKFQFSKEEILEELKSHPEKFSPNVILRPLYQETILPNVCYVGGSGEIAYWLQLKDFFASQNILFPILSVRNSLLILTEKQKSKLEKLGISFEDLFLPLFELVQKNVKENSGTEIDFESYESQLNQMFEALESKASQTDISFSKMVRAQKTKQIKGLENMKKRLRKAEKIKHSDRVERIEILYSELFPFGNLQERIENFSEFWLNYGTGFVKEIHHEIQPVDFHFTIKTLP